MREQEKTTKLTAFTLSKQQQEKLKELIEMAREDSPMPTPHRLQEQYIGMLVNNAHADNSLREQQRRLVKTMMTLSELSLTGESIDLFLEDIVAGVRTIHSVYELFWSLTEAPCLTME